MAYNIKSVLVFSGGLDSTVLLYQLLAQGHRVHTLTVDYGQRHCKETQAAQAIAQDLGLVHRCIDLKALQPLLDQSTLIDATQPMPQGPYTEDNLQQTVVPNRNMILLAIAAAWAINLDCQAIAYGAHAADHATYPDCRPAFIGAMSQALGLCHRRPVELLTPFSQWDKADIVSLGQRLGVPFEKTWSCYQGKAQHCGTCSTCVQRREAFIKACVADPTAYTATSE
jgi:7-cyano-7-deazaguanine synthase